MRSTVRVWHFISEAMINSAPFSDQSSPSVLVVDDHADVRAGLKMLISSRAGWRVCGEAETGEQAISLALELKPSAVVMDVSLPGIDRLEATRRIRARLERAARCDVGDASTSQGRRRQRFASTVSRW